MFQDKKRMTKKVNSLAESEVTIITSGCSFSGTLFCRGSSRIGGKIEGKLVSEGILIIEESAEVKANITAEEIIIRGDVEGTVTAAVRAELFEKSCFKGELTTQSLIVHEGAQMNGNTTMVPAEDIEKSKDPSLVDEALDADGNISNIKPLSDVGSSDLRI